MRNDTTDRRTLLTAGAPVAAIWAAECIELDDVTGDGTTPTDGSPTGGGDATATDATADATPTAAGDDRRRSSSGRSGRAPSTWATPGARHWGSAEPVTFDASADQAVRITMRSESIGPYLVVADGSGTIVAENDDGADRFDSRDRWHLHQQGDVLAGGTRRARPRSRSAGRRFATGGRPSVRPLRSQAAPCRTDLDRLNTGYSVSILQACPR
jgi:hypothetical protein